MRRKPEPSHEARPKRLHPFPAALRAIAPQLAEQVSQDNYFYMYALFVERTG